MTEADQHPTDRASLERDCEVEYVRVGGPGGQHKNKRETGVRLRHAPTGVMVTATERRSREQNEENAFDRMAARLDAMQHRDPPRRPTRPGRGAVERRLKAKRALSDKKAARRGPED